MTPISPGLIALTQLEALDLSWRPLEKACCLRLTVLSCLHTLLLRGTKVTDEEVQARSTVIYACNTVFLHSAIKSISTPRG
jgi:hypothetical protein